MPGFDGKGPKGLGAMTGSGRGYCVLKQFGPAGSRVTGYAGLDGHPVPASPGLDGKATHGERREAAGGDFQGSPLLQKQEQRAHRPGYQSLTAWRGVFRLTETEWTKTPDWSERHKVTGE